MEEEEGGGRERNQKLEGGRGEKGKREEGSKSKSKESEHEQQRKWIIHILHRSTVIRAIRHVYNQEAHRTLRVSVLISLPTAR